MADTRRKKREKVGVGPGLRECEAGYETNNYGELRVDREGYMHRRGQNTSVPRLKPQTELGLYKTKKERESECWARIKGV